HGMYTAARALSASGVEHGAAGTDAFTWDVTFGRPVLLPGRVAFAVRPAEGETGAAGGAGTDGGSGGSGGVEYLGWNPRSGARHFSRSVIPLVSLGPRPPRCRVPPRPTVPGRPSLGASQSGSSTSAPTL